MRILALVIGLFIGLSSFAQPQLRSTKLNEIKQSLNSSISDKDRVLTLAAIVNEYSFTNFDSAYVYGNKALELAKRIKYPSGEIKSMCVLGIALTRNGDMPKAIELELKALQLAQDLKLDVDEGFAYYSLCKSYFFLKDYETCISYGLVARNLFATVTESKTAKGGYFSIKGVDKGIGSLSVEYDNEMMIAEACLFSNQLDSAIHILQRLKEASANASSKAVTVEMFLGYALFLSGKTDIGLHYLHAAYASELNDYYRLSWIGSLLAECYRELNQTDSAIHYAKIGLDAAQQAGFKDRILKTSQLLATMYEPTDILESHKYLKLAATLNNEMFGQDKVFELQSTLAQEQKQKVESEKRQLEYQNNIRLFSLLGGLSVVAVIALILYRNYRQKHKVNKILEATLSNLKSTQSQLIQSEKMASLGELTAGIAHEIQNPLNFVNNFSEVSNELIQELKSELDAGNREQVFEIINDISQNLVKINHHGKRADGIVKGMLQHSRASSGKKELTDINGLCDEYLRLSYHGLRAKDKSFNAKFEMNLDTTLSKINVVPQDIGKVILNLINNAFYAVNDKAKQNLLGYEPTVTVCTKKVDGRIEVRVKDNGNGIPDSIKEKIFQPFFTTKPTGHGTGLGLSLAYDIVKAHGGELKVETSQGEGSEFSIKLPI